MLWSVAKDSLMILIFEMFSNMLLVALHSCAKSAHICPVLLTGLISAFGTFRKKVVSSAYYNTFNG